MVYFIDSNIFLRVLIQENVQSFQICSNILAQIESKEIKAVTSDLVLAEIVWVLTSYYNRPRSEIVKSIELINNMGMKTANAFDRSIAIRLYGKYSVKYIASSTSFIVISTLPSVMAIIPAILNE